MLHNMLKKEGNIKISGEPGAGKTTMLKLLLGHAIEFEDYDEIAIYASSGEDYSEFFKDKRVKLGQFINSSLVSTFFNIDQSFSPNKQRLVIVDDFDAIVEENIYNGFYFIKALIFLL